MTEVAIDRVLPLALPLLGGALIGAVYCLTLWRAAERVAARRPGALLFGMAARVAGVTAAVMLLGGGEGLSTAVALTGFLIARTVAVRLARRTGLGA